MSGKTIVKILLVLALIYIAGQPLGQMIAAIGTALVSLGNTVAHIGANFHG